MITYRKGNSYAREVGKKSKASIVIWGGYNSTKEAVQITSNFEVLIEPEGITVPEGNRDLTADVAQLENFIIQQQISEEMTFLVLLTIGLTRYVAKDYKEAVELFSGALQHQVVDTKLAGVGAVFFYRGVAYSYQQQNHRAIQDFNKAIELEPDYAEAYNNRGLEYAIKEQYDLAMQDYDKAIELNPKLAQAYINRGLAYILINSSTT